MEGQYGYLPNGQYVDPDWENLDSPMYCDFLDPEFQREATELEPHATPDYCNAFFANAASMEGMRSLAILCCIKW